MPVAAFPSGKPSGAGPRLAGLGAARHGRAAHALMPGSRLELFERAGHFPFNDEPQRFAALLHDFVTTTAPAAFDDDAIRTLMLRGRL